MNDREKVINGLECHRIDDNHRINCTDCPYYVDDDNHIQCVNDLHDDAISLLKEQDAKTGHWIYRKYDDMFMCSSCEKYSIRNDYPYCHWCGAKMKQESR